MKKILFALLFSVFLFSATAFPALSQEMTVGVSVDDYFTYEGGIIEFSTSNDSLPVPANMFMGFISYFNDTDYETRTVTAVTGTTNITFAISTMYSNGTEDNSEVEEDITASYWYRAIGANMEEGDEIRPAGWTAAVTLNETIMWGFGEETREVNTLVSETDWSTWFGVISTTTYYWDKETGILVKQTVEADYDWTDGTQHMVTEMYLVDTNLWVIPEFPTSSVMLLVFVAATVCIDLYRRKKIRL